MKVWAAIKRLDSRSTECARRAVERVIVHLDRPGDDEMKPAKKHLGIWDLVARGHGR